MVQYTEFLMSHFEQGAAEGDTLDAPGSIPNEGVDRVGTKNPKQGLEVHVDILGQYLLGAQKSGHCHL